jgi:hypothetical protein
MAKEMFKLFSNFEFLSKVYLNYLEDLLGSHYNRS